MLELGLNLRKESDGDTEQCEILCLKKDEEVAGNQC